MPNVQEGQERDGSATAQETCRTLCRNLEDLHLFLGGLLLETLGDESQSNPDGNAMSDSRADNTSDRFPTGSTISSQARQADKVSRSRPTTGVEDEHTHRGQPEDMSIILAFLRNLRGETSTGPSCSNVEDEVHSLSIGFLKEWRDTGAVPSDLVARVAMDSIAMARQVQRV